MGMVASGALFNNAQQLQVFKTVPALNSLVPALLGLKGNLEMTLGARLGSHANKRELDGSAFWPIVRNNLLAVQCQAIIVGTAASIMAVVEGFAATGVWDTDRALLLTASAITAASLASLVLSCLMISIVVAATKKGVDPDNISAPIAGMLGDFCTLGVVVLVAMFYWSLHAKALFRLFLAGLTAVYMVLAAFCFAAAYRSGYTREIMVWGWPPVILSMMLSSLSGKISEASIKKFSTFARFQVVMNGAGGNLGAIFCSKLSTDLLVAQREQTPKATRLTLPGPSRLMSKTLLEESQMSSKRLLDEAGLPRTSLPGPYRALSKSLPYMGHLKAIHSRPHLCVQTSWVHMADEKDYLSGFASISALTGGGDMKRFARMLLLLILPGQA
ncbi:unnamed protein product, partial [Prorocentrum cordatum]